MSNTPKFNADESIMTIGKKKYSFHNGERCEHCDIVEGRCDLKKCDAVTRKDARRGHWKRIKNPSLKTQRMYPIDNTVKSGDKVWDVIRNKNLEVKRGEVHAILVYCERYFKGHLKPGYNPILMIND